MAPTTPINPAINPEVTQTNTTTTGENPAEALGNLYEEASEEEADSDTNK